MGSANMRRILTIGFGILLQAMPVLAQSYDPPTVRAGKEPSMMYEWLIGAGFLVGCLIVAFKPSKRANVH